jgi:gliding motility-associated-like protein
MKKFKAVINVFKALLFFYMLLIGSHVFAQGGTPITIPSIPGRSLCDDDFPINAVAVSPAPLLYSSSNLSVATISATGVVHIVGVGTTTISAFQAGNPFTASQSLDINTPSPPTVTITADLTSACVGSPVTFSAITSELGATVTYQWLLNGLNAGTNSPIFKTPVIATDVVQCIATVGNCHLTGVSNQITGIKSNPYLTPSVSIIPSVTGTICTGSTVTFTASPINGGTKPTYQWQVNGVNEGTNAATFTTNSLANGDNVSCALTVSGPGCYTPLIVTSNNMSISTATATVGSVIITASGNSVKSGTSITFTAASALPASKYQWQVNGVNAGTNSPIFTTRNLKKGDVVTCIALISGACTAPVQSNAIVMTILAPATISVVNTFTPNGDGINDLWEIPDLSFFPNCLVTIYNRYGAVLFQSRGYSQSWDGNYKGRKLPVATYYYVIDLNGAVPTAKVGGYVTIIR